MAEATTTILNVTNHFGIGVQKTHDGVGHHEGETPKRDADYSTDEETLTKENLRFFPLSGAHMTRDTTESPDGRPEHHGAADHESCMGDAKGREGFRAHVTDPDPVHSQHDNAEHIAH